MDDLMVEGWCRGEGEERIGPSVVDFDGVVDDDDDDDDDDEDRAADL